MSYVMSKGMYDHMCKMLTDYENPEDVVDENDEVITDIDWAEEFYDLLVEIQNDVCE